MRETLKKNLTNTVTEKLKYKEKDLKTFESWVDAHEGQLVILSCQLEWTSECTKNIIELSKERPERPARRVWKDIREGQSRFI